MAFFQVRDLMINVMDDRLKLKRGGAMLCTIDQPTQINCGLASPVMHAVRLSPRFERVVATAGSGDPDGIPMVAEMAGNIGVELVAGAALGGWAGMPDPNCGGTSLETIPPTITPVVHKGSQLQISDLPSIKQGISAALAMVEKLEAEIAPRAGIETEVVQDSLKQAMEALKKR